MTSRSRSAVFLATITALSSAMSAYAANFSDVSGSPNAIAIQYLSDKGVIGGYPDGTFRPRNTVNRAELAKFLVGGTGATPSVSQYNNCFPDVTTEWFAPFVCYAKAQGWVAGYSDGTFRPSNTVNTAEAIKMIVNAQGYSVPQMATSNSYSDVFLAQWFDPFVQVAHDKNILDVSSGVLGVGNDMTRGRVAESMYRAMYIKEKGLQSYGSAPFISSDPALPPPPASSSASPIPVSSSSTPPPPPPASSSAQQGAYKDGQYTGPSVDAYYGNVQVKVTVQNGKISDVVFLDYPQDRNTSVMINSQAMPYLKAEAIQAQSAPVDIISGATATSGGFNTSFAAALAQAKN